MYCIELATKEDISALTDFFSRVYGPKHITTDREYLDWQYLKAPGNVYAPKYPNLLFKKGTAVVGHLGLIPYTFIVHGTKRNGAYCASLIVDEALRSHGAGALLVREAEKYFDILYTARANELAQSALRYCNWSEEFFMTRWIYNYTKQVAVSPVADDSHIVTIQRFDKTWDDSWQKLQKGYDITIDHSSGYLNWRFVDTFKVSYTILGYKDTLFEGYVVLRIEEGDEFRACRIVDFMANKKSALPLLQAAVCFGSEKKLHFADFFSFPEIFAPELRDAGFYIYNPEVNPDPPMFILPTSRKRLTTNVFYKITDGISLSPHDWYMTKADGDRDRSY